MTAKFSVKIFNPIGSERILKDESVIKFTINGNIYRISIDKTNEALQINKIGAGGVRGQVDKVTIIPETSNQFLIK